MSEQIPVGEAQVLIRCAHSELRDPRALEPHPRNPNTHPEAQLVLFEKVIRANGFRRPVTVSKLSGKVTKGHGALMAALRMGLPWVPVDVQDYDSEEQEIADMVADNQLAEYSQLDPVRLQDLLDQMKAAEMPLEFSGFTEASLQQFLSQAQAIELQPAPAPVEKPDLTEVKMKLADRFGVPPFSVLDARQGYWKDRKNQWMTLGIRSELGRGENLLRMSDTVLQPDPEKRAKAKLARTFDTEGTLYQGGDAWQGTGTSIFDPVVCELMYRWFCPQGGTILDPFAGGSVRGVVASLLGRQYVGCDLRGEQVEANRAQGIELCRDPLPIWHCGDSRLIQQHAAGVAADFIFSCPPYADLEVYSDDPADISTLEYPQFMEAYAAIIRRTCAMLKQDRFAAFVVGDVRAKNGHYRNFVGDTTAAFREAGLEYYNETVLVTAVGSLAIRAGRVFSASRKLGKTHQNILVFVKGDWKKAVEACGPVNVEMPPELEMLAEASPDSEG